MWFWSADVSARNRGRREFCVKGKPRGLLAHVCDLIDGWGRRFAVRSRIPESSYFKDSAVIEQDPKTQSGGKKRKEEESEENVTQQMADCRFLEGR